MSTFARTVRLVVLGGAMSYRALFNWTSPPIFIGTLIVSPLFQIFFFVHVGRTLGVADDRFYLIGNTVLAASVSCVYGGVMAVSKERRCGTLGMVLLSPRARIPLWAGRVLPYVGNGFLVMGFMLVTGALALGIELPLSVVGGVVMTFLVAAVSCAFFGLSLGALSLRVRDASVVSNMAFTLLILFSGANLPHEAMPAWMQAVATVTPMSHGIEALRELFAGASYSIIWPDLAAEGALAVGYATLALVLLRHFERRSRATASLDIA
ncbi:ABC transporter permease [Streptomyces mirabilis]|uniref:ABC transporter permease n=1 Tax=Streptomyces mirabilis TaxID=68239 RepID=UPI0033A45112